ncbi:hypothetical protein CRENBAI_012144 [Crenichthys baileyi]|uniref:Serine-threonine/tyrosine-protein kinase catalytic domain-containing protein n=1 Tax=Crenichthys baileyi TaxID=28760 RepID=A0AAV9SJE0_9TELE
MEEVRDPPDLLVPDDAWLISWFRLSRTVILELCMELASVLQRETRRNRGSLECEPPQRDQSQVYCAVKIIPSPRSHTQIDTTLYDVMKQCWDEDPLSRPSFSSLVTTVGSMLGAEYRQNYLQLTEDFLKGENPAVVQSTRSLSRRAEDEMDERKNNTTGSPASEIEVHLLEADPEELGPSHSTYIMPVSDVTIETSTAPDAVSPLLTGHATIPESKESSPEAAEPPSPSCSHEEEEESCL